MTAFENKVFIVTGASKGFGFAIAKHLLAQGSKVGLIARGQAGLDKALIELDAGAAVMAQAASVDDKQALTAAVDAIAQHFGGLDGMINNAGIARPSSIASVSEADLVSQMSINVNGTVYVY